MDLIVEVAADPGGADARLFGFKIKQLAHHAGLPEQVPAEPAAIFRQAVHVVGEQAAYGVPSLADQFSNNHDEQLTYDNPPTSKNSDGFSL